MVTEIRDAVVNEEVEKEVDDCEKGERHKYFSSTTMTH
jgi:hypothetical protein